MDLDAELEGEEAADPAAAERQESQREEEYDDDLTQGEDEDATQQSEEGPGSPHDAPRTVADGNGASTGGSSGTKRRAMVVTTDEGESKASSSGCLLPTAGLPPPADSEDDASDRFDSSGNPGDAQGSSRSLPWKRKLTDQEKGAKQVVKPCDRGQKKGKAPECGGPGVCMCPREHPHPGRCKLFKSK